MPAQRSPTTESVTARGLALGLGWLLAFAVAASALLGLRLEPPFGDPLLAAKLDAYAARRSEIDTVFVGSSLTYRHIVPTVFDRETESATGTATRSYNLGVDAQFLPKSARTVDLLLARAGRAEPDRALRRVVLELGRFESTVDPQNAHTLETIAWRTAESTLSMLRYLAHRDDKSVVAKLYQGSRVALAQAESWLHVGQGSAALAQWLGVDRGHPGIAPDADGFLPADVGFRAERARGEPTPADRFTGDPRSKTLLERLEAQALRAFEAPPTAPNPEGLRVVDALRRRADAAGVELLFVVPPRLGDRYEEILPIARSLPASEVVLDLADPRLQPEFYALEGSIDAVHFDRQRAERYTRKLAAALAAGSLNPEGI